ncbi:styrene monooxygenase/indole monooxygenase family protein [Micromonospora sp. URMC 103]|uniref:styrene monooxygenase/indole monooxygenase family protein n=1 Tax=Micromonospora sp. URMC 103 TaxID=3423406 RepID=UPI003F1AB914
MTTADLDGLTKLRHYDLTIVAAGKGDLVGVFDRDPQRSVYTAPQRGLAVAYVHGMTPDPLWPVPHVSFNGGMRKRLSRQVAARWCCSSVVPARPAWRCGARDQRRAPSPLGHGNSRPPAPWSIAIARR